MFTGFTLSVSSASSRPNLAVYGADYFEVPLLMSGVVLTPKVASVPPDEIKLVK
jgi:hypothetical protein